MLTYIHSLSTLLETPTSSISIGPFIIKLQYSWCFGITQKMEKVEKKQKNVDTAFPVACNYAL